MRSFLVATSVAWLVVSLSDGAAAQDFRTPPTVIRVKDKIKIDFAVTQATDVEVAVMDVKEKVVRHLAAGKLGGTNPPPAPLVPGLTQVLFWDGKNDAGQPAGAGPFQVRVRAGLTPTFGRTVGDSSHNFNQTMCRGLAVDANGDLYFMGLRSQDATLYFLRVYDRTGKFLREVLPYPSTLTTEERKPFGIVEGATQETLPQNYYSLWPNFYPFHQHKVKLLGMHPTDSSVVLMSESPHAVYRLRKTNGAAGAPFVETLWAKGKGPGRTVSLPMGAFGPDGKTFYFSGFASDPALGKKASESFPDGRVYKWQPGKEPETFVDVPMPADAAKPTLAWHYSGNICALHGVTVDKAGRVFVCDALNGKVWVYQADGKQIGAVAVAGAYHVAANEKTGALYVLTRRNTGYHKWARNLVKLSGWDANAKVLDTLKFPESGGAADPFLAADFNATPTQLWVGGCPRQESLTRIEDIGKLTVKEDLGERGKSASGFAVRLAVDPEADLVYINNGWAANLRYNGITGEYAGELDDGLPKPILGSELCVRKDGMIYRGGVNYSGTISRLNRDLSPAPLEGKKEFGYYYGRMGGGYFGNHGCTVAPDGRLFLLAMFNWCQYGVIEIGPDGKAVDGGRLKDVAWSDKANYDKAGVASARIGWLPSQCGGLKIGPGGHIYLGLRMLPRDYEIPKAAAQINGYDKMVGSVIKFAPTGGGVFPDDGQKGTFKNGPLEFTMPEKFGPGLPMGGLFTQHGVRFKKSYIEGGVRAYPGLSPFSGYDRSDGCVCQTPRFDVDNFGRVYIPNALTCSVTVADDAGNEIAQFGSYANFDSQGPKSAIPRPAIPLAYPVAVQVSQRHIYVADSANRRVVRVDVRWKAEATCVVK
jgi:hypothetical protein